MALQLNNGGILFTNVTNPGTQGSSKYNFEFYLDKSTGQPVNRNTTEISDPVNKFVNAIDIDWNGAVVGENKTLNTTGDMLSVLQTAYNYATTYNVKYSGGKLYDDKNTEITVGSNVTESTVSDWGFTKNTGTVTGVKINGSTYNPSNGVVDLGIVIKEHQDLSGKANKKHTHEPEEITTLSAILSDITKTITNLSERIAALEKHHESVPVTGISLGQTTATLTGKNATLTLTPTITPNNATNKSVNWASSSASVATVNGGVVTPLKAGKTTITATTTDGSNKSASCAVTVKEGTTTWSLTPADVTINEGEPVTFSMALSSSDTFVTPNANNTTWSVQYKDPSDNSYSFANILNTTVGSRVVATAPMLMSNSSATYYINATNNGYSKTAKLHVSQATVGVSSVKLDKTSINLSGSTSAVITATVEPANATNKSVTWKVISSNNAIRDNANDNKLTITGRTVGTATIIATADGKSSTSCQVTVTQGTISINGIDPSYAEIQEGDSKEFTVLYSSTLFAGTPHNFTWSCNANNSFLSSTSGTTITFNAPDELGADVSGSSVTYYISVISPQASGSANTSVKVKRKPQTTKYYWYAGWTEPTEANIASIINEEYPVSKTDSTSNKAGGSSNTNSGYSVNKLFASITSNRYYLTAKTNYYIVVPNNMGIYSSNSPTTSVLSTFTKHSEFNNHIVYKSNETSRNINFLVVY